MTHFWLYMALAASVGGVIVAGLFVIIWDSAHKYAFKQIQFQSQQNAEYQRDYEDVLEARNDALLENVALKDRIREAEMWVKQLTKDVADLYAIHGHDDETSH